MGTLFWIMIVIWIIIFVVTLIVELQTADLTSIWFCIGALGALIAALFNIEVIYQLLIFIAISGVMILATRPLTKKMMTKDIIHTNADRLVGMIGTVTQDIIGDNVGEVKVEGNLWRAITLDGDDINTGQKVIINSFSGNKIVVSKINSEKKDDIEIV